MTEEKPTSERLDGLKARWESDRGSRVFLQLADEYRRLGRDEDALAVLDEGLEASPDHVGARVARARCLLALDRAEEAATALERVIESDPTQMVAYRFLVDAYIRLRDPDRARQRLRVYGLLNDSDPDIDDLDSAIRDLERAERTGEWPAPGAEPASTGEGDELGEPPVEESPDESPPAPAEGTEEAPAAAYGPEEELPPFEDSERRAEAPAPPPVVEPFPSLGSPADRARALESTEDDLFAAPRGESAEPEAGAEDTGSPASAGPGEGEDPFDLPTEGAAGLPDLADSLPSGEPADEGAPGAGGGEERAAPSEGESTGPPAPSAAAEAREGPASTGGDEGRATVTLGQLYLRQGHHEEAGEIFREVLLREPDNATAREGLKDVELRRDRRLVAGELLEGYEPAAHGEGLTARKRYALRQYRERLRGGGSDVH